VDDEESNPKLTVEGDKQFLIVHNAYA